MADAGRGGTVVEARSASTVTTGTGVAGQVINMATRLTVVFNQMPSSKRNLWIAGGAMCAALVAGMFWYASRPDWRTLFNGLDGKDVQQVSQELAAAGIPYDLTPDGSGLRVPAEMLEKARMEVAAKGMPQTGRLGFELFDKPNWVGSEFDERVNYQRALEGELEHTIETLDVVRSARVHLVLPQATLYSSEEKQAKATVVLKLKRASLPAEQADSIRSLVAGAVENLSLDQVNLVDANGRINLAHRGTAAEGDAEQQMEAKLVAMLEPLAGAGNVRASVNVSYDQGTEERTDDIYDPTASAALTVHKTEQVSNRSGGVAAGHAGGVPGTASNAPAAAPEGAVQGSADAAAPGTPPLLAKPTLPVYPGGSPAQESKEENGTYAVSRHTVHSESGPGRLRRLTAAVVVNDRQSIEGAGKAQHAVWKPRSPEEMRRLEDLARAAVGFDQKRGDQVVMQNVAFDANTPEPKAGAFEKVTEEAKSLAGPSALRTGMIGVLGLLVVVMVLKPMTSQMIATMKAPVVMREELALGDGRSTLRGQAMEDAAARGGLAGGSISALGNGLGNDLGNGLGAGLGDGVGSGTMDALGGVGGSGQRDEAMRIKPRSREAIYDHVSDHIRREPAQSTRLLETWIGSANGASAPANSSGRVA